MADAHGRRTEFNLGGYITKLLSTKDLFTLRRDYFTFIPSVWIKGTDCRKDRLKIELGLDYNSDKLHVSVAGRPDGKSARLLALSLVNQLIALTSFVQIRINDMDKVSTDGMEGLKVINNPPPKKEPVSIFSHFIRRNTNGSVDEKDINVDPDLYIRDWETGAVPPGSVPRNEFTKICWPYIAWFTLGNIYPFSIKLFGDSGLADLWVKERFLAEQGMEDVLRLIQQLSNPDESVDTTWEKLCGLKQDWVERHTVRVYLLNALKHKLDAPDTDGIEIQPANEEVFDLVGDQDDLQELLQLLEEREG